MIKNDALHQIDLFGFRIIGGYFLKGIRLLAIILIVSILSFSVSAVELSATPYLPENCQFTPTYQNNTRTACSHSNTSVEVGLLVSETCYYKIYNYIKNCNICGQRIEGGTVSIEKDQPTHSLTWKTASCIGGVHTYENKCTACDYVYQSRSISCNGTCMEFNSLPPVTH